MSNDDKYVYIDDEYNELEERIDKAIRFVGHWIEWEVNADNLALLKKLEKLLVILEG